VVRTLGYPVVSIARSLEGDHEIRSSLRGIEAAVNARCARLGSDHVDRLTLAISSKADRMRDVLEMRNVTTDALSERDHELRASLFGIAAVAATLHEQRDRLPSADVDQLLLAIASEARRLRLMLVPRAKRRAPFDLAKAVRPAIVTIRSMGVEVRDSVAAGTMVHGSRDDVAEVVFALLDNARVHAGRSVVDVRAVAGDETTVLYVEDRGPGITDAARRSLFGRGCLGARSTGSGLGLFIARRLMIEQRGSLAVDARPGGGASFALGIPTSGSGWSRAVPRDAVRPAIVR
jgi:signal transduction histidine kinase